MTGHNSPPTETGWRIPVIGGTAADQRLLSAVPELAEALVAALLDRVPAYRRFPRELATGELVPVAARRIRALAHAVRTGLPAPEGEFAAVREAAARRAEEGVPLDAVLFAHHLGMEVCWELITRHADDGDAADLLLLNRLMLNHLRRAAAATCAGYLAEGRGDADERRAARGALVTALLDGAPAEAEAAAGRAGTVLPPAYAVLRLAVAEHPDERSPDVDRAVAGHRKLRRLRTELDHATRQSALSALTAGGGVVLVPLEHDPEAVPEQAWERLAETLRRLARAAGVTVRAGGAASAPAEVPAAAALAAEVLEVALAVGRAPGLHRLDDLLVEYQLSRPSRARSRLAALLAPLDGAGELLTTLRVHLAGGLSRRHTAQVLHLHPNTVDYRLRRIAARTGLDPTRPADLPRITAALAARDAERAAAGHTPGARTVP
ncbi:PucR C-terminal helix-turn-helix domain-containing protein [Streptomyces sp. TLI_053]|uniref:PucR family transcriptional regulator n=1 Tax=Streptomyces sp. TLI_053 TaxID=1855352 RepID=UPI00087C3894|nr:helix-turn-helix domain-containing protein [Streptomyces sp. TLI_053]SDT25071.1 PucR C-terminal helix-turn-helix domain-containing protein [Streptomyces sp. TLI_053]